MKKTFVATGNLSTQTIPSKTGHIFTRMGRYLTRQSTIMDVICALLVILFIYTGLNKMMDHEKFKFEMGRSPFIQGMSGFIAATLPAGELLIALALIVKRTRLFGLYLSSFIMALFTGYIWLMLNYAYDLPCSCGGVLAKMSWNDHLYFNAAFTLLAMTGSVLQRKLNA
jgi:hypothetical protein